MRLLLIICLVALATVLHGQSEKAYVVDTITINDPHKAFINKGGSLVTIYFDGSKLEQIKNASLKELINDESVYFTAMNFYSFFSPVEYDKTFFNKCSDNFNIAYDTKKISVYKIPDIHRFYLCLINIEYFNYQQRSVDYKIWKTPLDKGAYIKVVFPYCIE